METSYYQRRNATYVPTYSLENDLREIYEIEKELFNQLTIHKTITDQNDKIISSNNIEGLKIQYKNFIVNKNN